jgi:hypothetical protein
LSYDNTHLFGWPARICVVLPLPPSVPTFDNELSAAKTVVQLENSKIESANTALPFLMILLACLILKCTASLPV